MCLKATRLDFDINHKESAETAFSVLNLDCRLLSDDAFGDGSWW